jgi:hypothetical protein
MRLTAQVAALTLTACSAGSPSGPDDRICSTPAAQTPGAWGTCVHRWSYKLAGSPDPARVVAEAAVTACADAIAYQVNEAAADERLELSTQITEAAPGIALFHVVQARAGRCEIP